MVKSAANTRPVAESRLSVVRGFDRLLDRAGLAVESCEDVICNVLSSTVVRDISKGVYDGGCVMTVPCIAFESARAVVQGLTTHDAKLVRTETLCTLRCVTVAKAYVSRSQALFRVVP